MPSLDDAALRDRLGAEIRGWYRLLGESTPGGRLIERSGVLACVCPAAPERSYANAVLYDAPEALAGALDELGAAYDAAGVSAWCVWVPRGDAAATALLEQAGHVLDAEPRTMGRALGGEPLPAAEPPARWTADGDIGVAAALNDAAYGYEGRAFESAMSDLLTDRLGVYLAECDGAPACSVVIVEDGDNAGVEMVATLPAARGRGLARGLLRQALAEAAERGCVSTTLVATKLGLPVYERLGYRTLGVLEMWERRRPPQTSQPGTAST